MAPYHLLVAAAVVAAMACRSDALMYDPCSETGGCNEDDEYVECGSTQWYCPWSAGVVDYDDMSDCQYGVHGCHMKWCDNMPISSTCVPSERCRHGYTFNATTKVCDDIDECSTNTHNCKGNQTCENRPGYFRCKCPKGYRPTSWGCEDVNECARPFGRVCCRDSVCINKPGSYECQCKPGLEMGPSGRTCIDINECVLNTHNCHGNQTCKNRWGSFDCKCPLGFRLDASGDCVDINECTSPRSPVCRGQSECVNTLGSYICQCKRGYKRGNDAHSCIDVDECLEDSHDCEQRCINQWGSFKCACYDGFRLAEDGRTCLESGDCKLGRGPCVTTCVNSPPGSCECPPGYTLSSNGRSCHDINECEDGNVCQGEDQVCINTNGGYRCSTVHCPPGYFRDPDRKQRCRRVNAHGGCCVDDVACREQPLSMSYSHFTLPHNFRIPSSGELTFFRLWGPRSGYSSIDFDLELVDATTSSSDGDVELATRDHFLLDRTSSNEVTVSLVQPLQGPQDVELELKTIIYHHGRCGGSTLSKIFVYVSGNNF